MSLDSLEFGDGEVAQSKHVDLPESDFVSVGSMSEREG